MKIETTLTSMIPKSNARLTGITIPDTVLGSYMFWWSYLFIYNAL